VIVHLSSRLIQMSLFILRENSSGLCSGVGKLHSEIRSDSRAHNFHTTAWNCVPSHISVLWSPLSTLPLSGPESKLRPHCYNPQFVERFWFQILGHSFVDVTFYFVAHFVHSNRFYVRFVKIGRVFFASNTRIAHTRMRILAISRYCSSGP